MSWRTGDERRFLEGLGTGAYVLEPEDTPRRAKISGDPWWRLTLLKGYKKAAKNRVNWGTINPESVMRYVNEQIDHLGG